VTVGARLAPDADLIDRAEAAARTADAVVVVVGTNDDWETEGHDRDTLDSRVTRTSSCGASSPPTPRPRSS